MEYFNKIAIGLFFTYLVIFSGDIQLILNCGVQKMMKENIFVRHILIFLSIYLFVFILKWYNLDVINVKDNFSNNLIEEEADEVNNNKFIKNIKNKTKYLIDSVITTVIAYIIFIISTKIEINVFIIILIILLVVITIQIISKAYDEKLHMYIMKYNFIDSNTIKEIKKISKEKNIKYENNIILIHNISYILYLSILILMVYGFYKYYKIQKNTYGKKWNWTKFIFGIQKCKSIN